MDKPKLIENVQTAFMGLKGNQNENKWQKWHEVRSGK